MLKVACIPAYNEGSSILDVIKRTRKYVDKVLVCDDGSTDETSKKASEAGAEVIRHQRNLGKGSALKSLFQQTKKMAADVMITIDGDGQFLPEEIPKLLQPIIENNYDIVIGYRFDDNAQMPSYRKIGNKFLDKMTSMASDLPFRDTQSGFRAYSKKAIETIDFKAEGFGADAEILVNASRKGLKITEEKITVLYGTGGETSTKNPISHSYEVVSSLIELIAIRHPLRFLGIPGLALIAIGVAFAVNAITIFNETRIFTIPSTLVSIGAIVTGIILLMMSVVLFSISRTLERRT